MSDMTTPSREPGPHDVSGHGEAFNSASSGVEATPDPLAGWSILPLAVRIEGTAAGPDVGTSHVESPSNPELVPTARGIRSVLDHHKAVAACAEGPSYLQVAVLVDDAGRTASVASDGTVVPGDAVEELAATVHRMTGQQLEPVHPRLRRALVVDLDAPELPLLAATTKVGFQAVSREGWSILITDDEPGWWALRTGLTAPGVAISSDGAARSLEVLLGGDADPAGYTELSSADAVCGLSWGPQWQAVSAAEDTSDAAKLTREVMGICGAQTSQVQIESVASVFDLDPVDTKRLVNYVDGDSTPLVIESVLQLLGLPALAAKIVEGTKELDEIDGVQRIKPGSVRSAIARSLTEAPTAEGLAPSIHRAVLRRPEVLLAVAGIEAAAGTGLAALARRAGQAGPALGTLSALAFVEAAGMTAIYSAARRRKQERDGTRLHPDAQDRGGEHTDPARRERRRNREGTRPAPESTEPGERG